MQNKIELQILVSMYKQRYEIAPDNCKEWALARLRDAEARLAKLCQ